MCNAVYFTNLTNSCFDSPVTPTTYPFCSPVINSAIAIHEPTNFAQVVMHPGWQQAMANEFATLESNKT